MIKLKKTVLFITFVVCLIFFDTLSVFASDMEYTAIMSETGSELPNSQKSYSDNLLTGEERICETVEELLSELEKDIGGVIILSDDDPFILTGIRMVRIEVTKPTIIYMPSKGIEVGEWISLSICGPVTFIGTKGFTVNAYSYVSLCHGVLVEMHEGAGGESPIAFLLNEDANINADSTVVLRTDGANAVTILCNSPDCVLDLGYSKVSAKGTNARAILSYDRIIIYNVFLESYGDNSYDIYGFGEIEVFQVSSKGLVYADTIYSALSYFAHTPPNLINISIEEDMIPKKIIVYQDLAYGSDGVEFSEHIPYTYKSPSLDEELLFDFCISVECVAIWDLSGLDYSTPGIYTVTAYLEPLIPVSGISIPPITYEITVVDKNRVALYTEMSYMSYVVVQCIAPINDADSILFWLYEEGSGWRELTSTGNAVYANEWNSNIHNDFKYLDAYPMFQVSGLEPNSFYWVMVQVIGGPMEGNSNMWKMYTRSENGGDRTGTDRGGVNPPKFGSENNNQTDNNSSSSSESSSFPYTNGRESNNKTNNSSEPNNDKGHSASSNMAKNNVQEKSNDHTDTNDNIKESYNYIYDYPYTSVSESTQPEIPDIFRKGNSSTRPSQTFGQDNKSQYTQESSVVKDTENIFSQQDPKLSHNEEDQPQIQFDTEQSAPKPKFSVNTFIVFFLGIGVLCICILFFIRINKHGE